MELTTRDWVVILVGVGLILALTADLWIPAFLPAPPTPPYKYTTGLNVKFKIYDTSAKALVTANVLPEFWAVGEDPFSRAFTGRPVAVATYSSVDAVWEAPLDAGTYILTIREASGSPTLYPVKVLVTVSGTNSETREVWLEPVQINMDKRATVIDATPSAPCYPYNASGTYAAVSVMNTTLDASKNQTGYWFIEYAFDVSNAESILKSGRIYFSKISNFLVERVYIDGVECAVYEDTDASDDGLVGYFVTFPNDLTAGARHHVTVYVHALSQISETTFRMTIVDYYACQNSEFKWWTYAYKDLTVTK